MLTSGNQYLRPEYLTPLPTTLDAKKSPLALLAQTCSQIGADLPNPKLVQSAEKGGKSSKTESSKSKSPLSINGNSEGSSSRGTSSFKQYDPTNNLSGGRDKTQSPEERNANRVRTPKSSNSLSNGGRCSSSNPSETASPRQSPAVLERKSPSADASCNGETTDRMSSSSKSSRTTSPSVTTSSSKTNSTPSVLTSTTDPSVKDLPLGTFKPGVSIPPTSSSSYFSGYPPGGIPLPMDLMTGSLLSHHHQAAAAAAAIKSGAFGPYSSYARLKAAAAAAGPLQDSLVCRDPYCTGCNLSSHLLAGGAAGGKITCPAGCTQCDHVATSKAAGAYLGHNPVAAAYAHAQLAALAAASQLPFVCNWVSADAPYCGKRFSSSEELLQHLRSHTAMATSGSDANAVAAAAALSMLNSSSLPPPAHPLLHRTYPTPPLSPLATARYHPYSKPSLLPPLGSSALSSYPLGHPGLPPYLSPYSLYGPRLSTGTGMHP